MSLISQNLSNEFKKFVSNSTYLKVQIREDLLGNFNILEITDLHTIFKNPSNRIDLLTTQDSIQQQIIDLVKANNIKCVIFGGDILDRGLGQVSVSVLYTFLLFLKNLYDITEGNVYTVYGNHEFSYAKNNIFYWVTEILDDSVKEVISTIKADVPSAPIFPFIKCIPSLNFGDVHIHFMHWLPNRKDYTIIDDAPYVVGIYHGDILTYEVQEKMFAYQKGHGIKIHNTDIFSCVNLAILNHIHMKCQDVVLQNERKTLVRTPGASLPKAINEDHATVELPVISIGSTSVDNDYVSLSLGDITETIKEEIVLRQQSSRELTKIIQNSIDVSSFKDFEAMLQNETDPEIREILQSSDKPIIPTCYQYYNHIKDADEEDLCNKFGISSVEAADELL